MPLFLPIEQGISICETDVLIKITIVARLGIRHFRFRMRNKAYAKFPMRDFMRDIRTYVRLPSDEVIKIIDV